MTSNAPDPVKEVVREHRALAILRLLSGSLGFRSNDQVVLACLSEVGLGCARKDLEEQLGLLEREGLVGTDRVSDIIVIDLTSRGHEVSEGLSVVSGVAKPGPECPY